MLSKVAAPPTASVDANDVAPATVTVPPKFELPLTDMSSSKVTASPNVLFVNVSVVDVPTNVAALVGSVIVILPLKELCGGACNAA